MLYELKTDRIGSLTLIKGIYFFLHTQNGKKLIYYYNRVANIYFLFDHVYIF